jgi:hypothetical protein
LHANQIAEDRRRLEIERNRLEKELQNERSLIADKDGILTRSKKREQDLTDQLDAALDDVDHLESQCEELLEAKHRVDKQAETLKSELARGTALVAELERHKLTLTQRLHHQENDHREVIRLSEFQSRRVRELYISWFMFTPLTFQCSEKENSSLQNELKLKESEFAAFKRKQQAEIKQLEESKINDVSVPNRSDYFY